MQTDDDSPDPSATILLGCTLSDLVEQCFKLVEPLSGIVRRLFESVVQAQLGRGEGMG